MLIGWSNDSRGDDCRNHGAPDRICSRVAFVPILSKRTAMELLLEFRARYPERYTLRQLATMRRRLRVWRREAVKRLICDGKDMTQDVAAEQS